MWLVERSMAMKEMFPSFTPESTFTSFRQLVAGSWPGISASIRTTTTKPCLPCYRSSRRATTRLLGRRRMRTPTSPSALGS